MTPFTNPTPAYEIDTLLVEQETYDLVVFNDDVNTFDHVIETFVDILQHTPEQAEQCAIIIHHKGKCTVKNGDFETLAPLRQAICNKGLSAEIL